MKKLLFILLLLPFVVKAQTPHKSPFNISSPPAPFTFAYTNNGLWTDSNIIFTKLAVPGDTTIIGVTPSGPNKGKLYSISVSQLRGWIGSGGSGSGTSFDTTYLYNTVLPGKQNAFSGLTTDYLLKWNGTTLENSAISDDGANTVTIEARVLPEADNTRNLGASGKRWANTYTTNLFISAANGTGDFLTSASDGSVVKKRTAAQVLSDIGGASQAALADSAIAIRADFPSGGGSISVTEQKIYYRGEYYANKGLNTSTGAVTTSSGNAISDYIHINGGESVTIYTAGNYGSVTIYGWTYDTTLTAISEIRSNALIGTPLSTYTFTTPSNARFLNLYVRYNGRDFSKALQVKSTGTITYDSPVTPEQFTGSKSVPIQAAINFARYTSSAVVLRGNYTIDSTLLLSSGTTLVLDNAHLTLDSGSKTNIIRNEAVANPYQIFARGNKDIKIIGIGKAIIEGSKEAWGGGGASGVGDEFWRPISTLFANVQGFEVSGITFKNTNMWAFCAEQSRVGFIHDIAIQQDSSEYNQDGINIRRGSNRITIQNVRGVANDDIIAMTNLTAYPEYDILGSTIYEPYSTALDIHDIIIKNVQRDTSEIFPIVSPAPFYQSGILMLTAGGLKIYNVTIDGVSGAQQIQVGTTGYGTSSTVDEMYNINVSNTGSANIRFGRPIKQSSFVNVSPFEMLNLNPNCQFANDSRQVYRKFTNHNPEYFDATPQDYYTEIASSNKLWEGLRIVNKNPSGLGADLILENHIGNKAIFRQYPPVIGNGLDSSFGMLFDNKLVIATDGNLSTGGISEVEFRIGGYGTSQRMVRINSNGLGIGGGSPSYKLDIQATSGVDGMYIGNSAAGGAANIYLVNDGANTTFLRNYGSAYPVSYLQNKSAIGSTKSLIFMTDQNIGNSGTNVTQFFSGGYGNDQERMRVAPSGVSVGLLSNATALLHIGAGTATAAPLKLTSGTNLGTPEDGAFEYNGAHVYFTVGSTRYQLDQQSGGGGGGGSPAGSTGHIQFNQGGVFAASPNLFWDSTNKRLGIVNSSPSYGLDVNSTFRIGGFVGDNSTNYGSGNPLLYADGIPTPASNFAFTQSVGGTTVFNGTSISFRVGNSAKFNLNSSGHFVAANDNSNDIGAVGSTIRSGYFGTSLRAPKFETSSSVFWSSGTGSPEGAVTANVGSYYTRTDGGSGTTFYVKESGTGNTGWTAVASQAEVDLKLTIAKYIAEETPSGTINGSNATFTLANTPETGKVILYLNGNRLRSGAGNDWTISGSTITMLTVPETGDVLLATYISQ